MSIGINTNHCLNATEILARKIFWLSHQKYCGGQDSSENKVEEVPTTTVGEDFESCYIIINAADRIRTCEGTKPVGPKPTPLDRFGTAATLTHNVVFIIYT